MGGWNKVKWEDGTNINGRTEQSKVGGRKKDKWEDGTKINVRTVTA